MLAALVFVGYVLPQWVSYLNRNSTADGNVPYLEAAAWAERNVPKGDVVVVDDYLWVDLKMHGLDPLWMWKVSAATAPDWETIKYIIIQPQAAGHAREHAIPAGRLRALRLGEELRRRPYRPPGDRRRLIG